MRYVALVLFMSALTAGSAFADVRIHLRAQVAASCGVVGVDASLGDDLSRFHVTTMCNSERFNIVLLSPDGPIEVVSASSSDAAVTTASNLMAVTLHTPGTQKFDIQLAKGLENVSDLRIQIIATS